MTDDEFELLLFLNNSKDENWEFIQDTKNHPDNVSWDYRTLRTLLSALFGGGYIEMPEFSENAHIVLTPKADIAIQKYFKTLPPMDNSNELYPEYLRIVLLLSSDGVKDTGIKYNSLFEITKTTDNKDKLYNAIFTQERLAYGEPGLNPIVKITPKGIDVARKIKEQIYTETGVPFGKQEIDLPLEETSEMIFQLHKNDRHEVNWTMETFGEYHPKNASVAKANLIRKGILFHPNSSNDRKTALDSDFINLNSYSDCMKKIEEKESLKNKPSGDSYTIGDVSGQLAIKSEVKDSMNPNKPSEEDTQIARDGFKINKQMLIWTIVIVLLTVAGLIIALKK